MNLQPLGFRTLLDSYTDYERATRTRDAREAIHRRALRRSPRRTST